MTFFPEPIKPSEGRQEDEIKVSPIEEDKKGREGGGNLTPEKKRATAYGSVVVLLKKFAALFTNKEGPLLADELTFSIDTLKKLLNQLKEADQSENAHFCQNFSELWHTIHEEVLLAKRAKIKTEVDLAKVNIVLTDMDHYPPYEERKLSFYLSQYAGEQWLPVPFMEILKKLHNDYKLYRNASILEKWTRLLA